MRKKLLIMLCFVVLSGCSFTTIRKAISTADAQMKGGNATEALLTIDTALQALPEQQTLLHKKAEILVGLGQYDEFLQLRPRLTSQKKLMRTYLLALLKTGQTDAALTGIEEQIKKRTTADWLQLKGQALYLKSDYEGALKAFDAALDREPTNKEALANKAITLADSGKFFEALDMFDQALDLYPDDYLLRYNKATVLSDLGYQQKNIVGTGSISYYSEALRHFEKAYTLNPASTNTLVWLGITYLDLGAASKAHSALDIAITKDPKNVDARYYSAKAYMAEGNTAKATEAFKQLLKIDPRYELSPEERELAE